MKQNFEDQKKMREALRLEAQRNEYLFALMREQGVADRLDQNVGVDFINAHTTYKALAADDLLSSTEDSTSRRASESSHVSDEETPE